MNSLCGVIYNFEYKKRRNSNVSKMNIVFTRKHHSVSFFILIKQQQTKRLVFFDMIRIY